MSQPTLAKTNEAICLLIKYGVDQEDQEKVLNLLERYGSDHIALNVFHEFYSFLPDATNEAINVIRKLDHKDGTFLLAVSTNLNHYLYLSSQETAVFLGTHQEGIWDQEALEFIKCNHDQALDKYKALDTFPLYVPSHLDQRLCPVCSVAHSEEHRFGCPIEICPWCDGQLIHCNCRFTFTDKEQLKNDKQLDDFLELLQERGRIPFNAIEQGISYSGNKQ